MEKLYSIKIIKSGHASFRERVGKGLNAYNGSKIGRFNWRDVDIAVKDPKGKLIGGLVGGTYWGWLFVKMLWVSNKSRKQGWGTQLLREAEILALKHGCRHIHLDTFSFQAPDFYKKHGFKKFGSLGPFPRGSKRYFFYKKIK